MGTRGGTAVGGQITTPGTLVLTPGQVVTILSGSDLATLTAASSMTTFATMLEQAGIARQGGDVGNGAMRMGVGVAGIVGVIMVVLVL